MPRSLRNLVLILGDQLNRDSAAFDGFDADRDRVLMIECVEESTHVWSHKARIALFLTAMRHFATELRAAGMPVEYRSIDGQSDASFVAALEAVFARQRFERLVLVEPGDLRVEQAIRECATASHVALELREDRHFLCSRAEFARWAGSNRTLRMEFFYREMRRRHRVLMNGQQPLGGRWNFDSENRRAFGRSGPRDVPVPPSFPPDRMTREVIALVDSRYRDHPGATASFNWPVTRAEALVALQDFIERRLGDFGPHQDAMWTNLTFGWHSLLSAALNLKLLSPREVIEAAENAHRSRGLDLASAEGFIRQILGWREFMRGVYFLEMPSLKSANRFGHRRALPKWYWTGDTGMNCLRQCVTQTLDYGYAHHIQRLMVTGMFGVLAEIEPRQVCDWYLAVYVDAVEWVELPNTAGMALYANGGRFTSKPYVASGAYVKRMSNYCAGCRYRPEQRTGARACPLTTLYWNFLDRHEAALASNPRTSLMARNLARMSDAERTAVRSEARRMLDDLDAL